MKLAAPVVLNERSDILDVLRGLALLGIFLDNVIGFAGYAFFPMKKIEAMPTFITDAILGFMEVAFINGKFYTLFSLLFGIGFSIILIRNQQKGINPLPIFYRRLFILLLIGLFHLVFIWEGDILVLYALVGMLLPLFRKCSDRTLIIWAVALIASPIMIDIVKVILGVHVSGFLENLGQQVDKKNGIPTDETFAMYRYWQGSGWTEWRNWQASGYIYRWSHLIETNRIPKVLGIFLVGFYAGRKMIYANLELHTLMFKKLRKWGYIIGIPTSIATAILFFDPYSVPQPLGLTDTIGYAVSVVPLSLAYVSSICLFWNRTRGSNKWKILAAPGKMALSNYLMQTVFGITVFYGVGFGIAGNIGPTVFFPIVIAIYSIQVMYSNWWFKHFNFGPMEWIWRQLTYGKRLAFRKRI